MTWQKGRDTLQALIDRGELERVTASGERAAAILADARRHLSSAGTIAYLLSHIRLGGASIDHGGHHPRMTSTAQTGAGQFSTVRIRTWVFWMS